MHDQEPVHSLGLGADELDTLPLGKRRQRRMRRPGNEIDCPVAQRRIGPVNRKQQFDRDIEPFLLEEAEFRGGDGREIGVGDQIRNREFHRFTHTVMAKAGHGLVPSPARFGQTGGVSTTHWIS